VKLLEPTLSFCVMSWYIRAWSHAGCAWAVPDTLSKVY